MTDPNAIAENLRYYRKKKGLTQSELAELLYVSFQAVSGWETGATSPDLGNLCRLSDILGVTVDALLTRRYAKEQYYIGIDGGGSKTQFVLFSDTGSVLYTTRLEATNPDNVGLKCACDTLLCGVNACMEHPVKVAGIFAGLAGSHQKEILDFFGDTLPSVPFFIDSDAVNILAGGDCDIGFICGTGSVILARTGTGNHFCGGWGNEFGDPGSAFNIGREAVRASLAMEEGIGKDTVIRTLLCEKLGIRPEDRVFDALTDITDKGVTYIAGLATTVFSSAKLGDEVALSIIESEFAALMHAVNITRRRHNCHQKIATAGGVIEHNRDLLLPILHKYAEPGTEFVFSDLPPVYGACVECRRRLGLPVSKTFHDTFLATYQNLIQKGES